MPSPWKVLAGRYLPSVASIACQDSYPLMLKAAEVGTMAAAREAGKRADPPIGPLDGELGSASPM